MVNFVCFALWFMLYVLHCGSCSFFFVFSQVFELRGLFIPFQGFISPFVHTIAQMSHGPSSTSSWGARSWQNAPPQDGQWTAGNDRQAWSGATWQPKHPPPGGYSDGPNTYGEYYEEPQQRGRPLTRAPKAATPQFDRRAGLEPLTDGNQQTRKTDQQGDDWESWEGANPEASANVEAEAANPNLQIGQPQPTEDQPACTASKAQQAPTFKAPPAMLQQLAGGPPGSFFRQPQLLRQPLHQLLRQWICNRIKFLAHSGILLLPLDLKSSGQTSKTKTSVS